MVDFTKGITGAIGGATSGLGLGSAIPGLGTAVGAGIGGLLGGIGGLFGKKKKRRKLSTLDKNQQMLNNQQAQGIFGKGPLADLYNYDPDAANAVFDKSISAPAYRNFNENIVPGITGAFRSEGLENSSYIGDSLSRAGRDVQESLNAQRAQYLYGEQNNARNARRDALENLQNRTNFDYDNTAGVNSRFDIDAILESITPEAVDQLSRYLKKKEMMGG